MSEPCALTLCRGAAEEDGAAAAALERWGAWRRACRLHRPASERRFRRRAFQRARDRALVGLAMHSRDGILRV